MNSWQLFTKLAAIVFTLSYNLVSNNDSYIDIYTLTSPHTIQPWHPASAALPSPANIKTISNNYPMAQMAS